MRENSLRNINFISSQVSSFCCDIWNRGNRTPSFGIKTQWFAINLCPSADSKNRTHGLSFGNQYFTTKLYPGSSKNRTHVYGFEDQRSTTELYSPRPLGFEPKTSRLTAGRSTAELQSQQSYRLETLKHFNGSRVELDIPSHSYYTYLQLQVPLQLPCYDFAPIINPTIRCGYMP